MAKQRLFLFAGYDAHGIVDASLVHYVRALSELGDVVVYMDSDCDDTELNKLKPYVLYAGATRHREYDFGSYKRAYLYARDAGILQNYKHVYMVNDSVYGPLFDLGPILTDLESRNVAAFGLVCNPNRDHPHIQSWFIGMSRDVFMTEWFDKFITSVTHENSKGAITRKYEQGFSKLITAHGLKWECMATIAGRGIYNRVKYVYRTGVPFIKKVAFSRHGGTYGRQIAYVLHHIAPDTRDAILTSARRTFGDDYVKWLLTRNPIKIAYRGIKHGLQKIFSGKL